MPGRKAGWRTALTIFATDDETLRARGWTSRALNVDSSLSAPLSSRPALALRLMLALALDLLMTSRLRLGLSLLLRSRAFLDRSYNVTEEIAA